MLDNSLAGNYLNRFIRESNYASLPNVWLEVREMRKERINRKHLLPVSKYEIQIISVCSYFILWSDSTLQKKGKRRVANWQVWGEVSKEIRGRWGGKNNKQKKMFTRLFVYILSFYPFFMHKKLKTFQEELFVIRRFFMWIS